MIIDGTNNNNNADNDEVCYKCNRVIDGDIRDLHWGTYKVDSLVDGSGFIHICEECVRVANLKMTDLRE